MGLTRGVPAATLAAFAQPVFYPVSMAYLDWPDDPVQAHSGTGAITFDAGYDSDQWTGVGKYGEIVIADEGTGLVPRNATARLVDFADQIHDYMEDAIRNRAAALYIGALTKRPQAGVTSVLAGDPIAIFTGHMDELGLNIEEDDEDGVLKWAEVGIASGPSARSTGSITHSLESQEKEYPGDTAGRHTINNRARVEALQWPEP